MKPSLILGLAALCAALGPSARSATWELAWEDEFRGPAIDRSNWTYDIGGGGWGNNELEYYTDRSENSRIVADPDGSGDGMLLIEARQEQTRNRNYTSARLKTQGLQAWTYGKIEARIKIPVDTGIWPAFWMLGANFSQVGWPDCGEIDILEYVTSLGTETIRGSAHAPGYSGANSVHGDYTFGAAPFLENEFHVYGIEWEPAAIRWYVDGTLYFTATPPLPDVESSVPGPWVFDHSFFIILNLAVGGNWPGPPNGSTEFPSKMFVDYVRVYRDTTLGPPPGEPLHVASIAMATSVKGPTWEAVATVTVQNSLNQPVSGVVVRGAWSGLINVGVTERTTDSNGRAVLNSGKVRQLGKIRFCVTALEKPGHVFTPNPSTDCNEIAR